MHLCFDFWVLPVFRGQRPGMRPHRAAASQDHYDFGMRALKSILVAAGQLRRKWGSTRPEDLVANEFAGVCVCVLVRIVCKMGPLLSPKPSRVQAGLQVVGVHRGWLGSQRRRFLVQCLGVSRARKPLHLHAVQPLERVPLLRQPSPQAATGCTRCMLSALNVIRLPFADITN